MKKIEKARLPELFAALNETAALYLPADRDGVAAFTRWQEGVTLTEKLNTVRSAKDLFFPQVETLANFKTQGGTIEIEDAARQDEDFIVFGVRACDLRSFEILDRVFLAEPQDTFYKARREHAAIITLACNAPEETCFCTAFSIDAADPQGDVTAFLTDTALCLRANTEKGENLLAKLPLSDGAESEIAAWQKQARETLEKLPIQLDLSGFTGERMMELFNHPAWQPLSEACLGCGTCTFVCPTCQCYDVKDFKTKDGVQRFRCWDSCMYSDFTMMSAGQPRPTQKERFRQRFMHKLVYYPMNNEGIFSCVGCGRCLQKCPIHMNIVKVAKTLGGERDA
ncbi:MAG: 4Fe-4S dicluster domain-containing protein [Oscillospiraceae bacterium]|nr:4Fe-4S dicluster domain-containing protein [Oscillospiraceae bacterium]